MIAHAPRKTLGASQRAVKLWDEGRDPRGTVAEDYLRSRALELPPELAGSVLRFHPRCPWRNENTGQTDRIPALIAAFRSIDDDQITAVHRIRLDQPQRWPKADRRMLGVVHRAAVKLDPLERHNAVHRRRGRDEPGRAPAGLTPTWALGSVGAISFFPVISWDQEPDDPRRDGQREQGSAAALRTPMAPCIPPRSSGDARSRL